MMRIRFRSMSGGHDQILIEDSSSRPVMDYKLVSASYIWTPWVAGDTLTVHLITTEPEWLGGVDTFSFSIDTIQYFDAELPTTTTSTTTTETVTTTTETSTTTTETSTTTSSPPDDLPPTWTSPMILVSGVIVGLIVVVVIWTKRT